MSASSRRRSCGRCGQTEGLFWKAFLSSSWESSSEDCRRRPYLIDSHSCGIFHSLSRRPIRMAAEGTDTRNRKIRRKFEADLKRQLIAQIEGRATYGSQAAREHQLSRSANRVLAQAIQHTLVDHP